MWIVLDLIIAAIILVCIFLSAKRGFARTIVEVVGYFLAIYLAFTLGGVLSEALYDSAIEPTIVESVADKITVSAGTNINETVDNVWNSLPKIVTNAAETFDITSDTLREAITENFANNSSVTGFAQSAVASVVRPIVVPLMNALIGFILFIVLMFVVKFLAKIINKAFSLPLIGGLNRFLGGVVGFLKGTVISVVFVTVILFIMSFFENGFLIFTNENVEQSILFNLLAGFSPFK